MEGVEGLGIGLYNAKRIADAHGGSLELEQLPDDGKISDYNVPLIESYIKRNFSGKANSKVELLKKELESLNKSGKYDNILADNTTYVPTKSELLKFIDNATWEVKFRVTIPAKRS